MNKNSKIWVAGANGMVGKNLINILKKLITSESEITYHKLPENDPKLRKPDISLAKKVLEWEPKVNIVEGLNKTIPWFKEEIRINK